MTASVGVLIHRQLSHCPSRIVSWLADSRGVTTPVTAEQLAGRAGAFASMMPPVPAGDTSPIAAICLYPGLDLRAAWLGALWAGYLPSIVPPPSPRMAPAKYASGLRGTMQHMRAVVQVVEEETAAILRDSGPGPASLVSAASVGHDAVAVAPVDHGEHAPALVQHSSGTTGLQKAIALTTAQLQAHDAAYRAALDITSGDVVVSWLPLYHDMGFITALVMPLLHGLTVVEMSPFDWVRRPLALLELIERHRGTLCWMPNFAFSFMADADARAAGRARVDVSGMRAWINSSEPVMARSFERFLAAFAGDGVHRAQLTASYAMAENVYAVTQSRPGRLRTLDVDRRTFVDEHRAVPAADGGASVSLVSNGSPLPSTAVRIVDRDGAAAAAGYVGAIHVRGTHCITGYFNRADLTAAAIDRDGWYVTGDLGFVDDGELYVTGRAGDLIIVQGRNFYPADIEAAAADVSGVAPGRVVAFGLTDGQSGTERLIVLAERAGPADEPAAMLALRIRTHIAQSLSCTPDDVRIVDERWLVKSTSGKLARGDNRAKYLAEHVHVR